jgi:predicted MPP superfamily phosphohydrolase
MSGKELVMAIVCKPLSSRDILQTEKENNVVIFRKIIYDRQAGYEALTNQLEKLRMPLKFFFIFGLNDCLLVNGAEDLKTALERLVTV